MVILDMPAETVELTNVLIVDCHVSIALAKLCSEHAAQRQQHVSLAATQRWYSNSVHLTNASASVTFVLRTL